MSWSSGCPERDNIYDPADPASLQASFKLGDNDTALLMSDAKGNQVIRQDIEKLPENISKGRSNEVPDNWLYFPQATPGSLNTTAGFAEISGAMTLKNHGLWINEVVAQNSSRTVDGKISQPDWIELYNGTLETVSLDGYGLSDNIDIPYRMTLSGLSIEPGAYLVIEPTGFGISTADETLYLSAPDKTPGRLVSMPDGFATASAAAMATRAAKKPVATRFFLRFPDPRFCKFHRGLCVDRAAAVYPGNCHCQRRTFDRFVF